MIDHDNSGICPRCGAESFDGTDLCEDCFGDVTLGKMLTGEYGSEEQDELNEAIDSAPMFERQSAPLRKRRLREVARRFG